MQKFALLLSFMIIISISVPSYAINYDSRTKAIKASVKKTSKAACYDAPFVYGSAICQGYALAYMYLCKKANLYCRFVTGNVDDNETSGHAWNLVKINKGTYFVDLSFYTI